MDEGNFKRRTVVESISFFYLADVVYWSRDIDDECIK